MAQFLNRDWKHFHYSGYTDLLLWLIEHGADLKRRDAKGQRIDEYLAGFDKPEMIELLKERIVP